VAILKPKEIRNLSRSEIDKKAEEMKKELIKLKSQVATKAVPENPGRIREIGRTLARILTIQNEKRRLKLKI